MDANSETHPRRLKTAERRQQVWALRVGGASLRAIAKQFGVTAQTIFRDLQVCYSDLNEQTSETIAQHVKLDLARCERLMLAMMPQVQKGSAEACRTAVRILERKARLLGLDAPDRVELTGRGGGPIETQAVLALAALPDDELRARMRRFEAALQEPVGMLPPGPVIDAAPVAQPAPPDDAVARYERVLAERAKGNGHGGDGSPR